jgi:hypothetical protein
MRNAARALLELYARLQGEQAREEELAARMPASVTEQ